MKLSSAFITLLGSIALGATAPALAQDTTDTRTTTYPAQQQDNDDDSGKLGPVGLLGLAGLLGLKRRDRDNGVRRSGSGTRP